MIEYAPALLFSALLSVLLETVPGLKSWWSNLTSGQKAIGNALGVALISIAVMFYNCRYGTVCPADTGKAIIDFLLLALVSLGVNQGVYLAVRKENFQ